MHLFVRQQQRYNRSMKLIRLKAYLPRSLYSRAALILFTPVLVIQLVFGFVFLSNHFERITRQMTVAVIDDLSFIFSEIPAHGFEAVRDGPAARLGYTLVRSEPPESSMRRLYDISILYAEPILTEVFPVLAHDTVSEDGIAIFWIEQDNAPLEVRFPRSRISASNPHQLVLWTLLAGVLMYFIALIFLRNQLRPIRRLARAAEAFGRGQHIPFHPTGATEVRAAGLAFLDMRARIDRHIDQRTMMLSTVSHDLRTPLTRIRLGLEMIEDDTEDLEHEVDEMQEMLDGFLNFARDGVEEPTLQTNLSEMITRIVKTHQRKGNAAISIGEIEASGMLPIRPMLFGRAIENLIVNALRYGAEAQVSLRVRERSLRIRIEDDGPGIPQASREHALRPFSRLDLARNQNKGGGVGLGLTIAADAARVHGGTLRLGDSQALGGLAVDIILPRT